MRVLSIQSYSVSGSRGTDIRLKRCTLINVERCGPVVYDLKENTFSGEDDKNGPRAQRAKILLFSLPFIFFLFFARQVGKGNRKRSSMLGRGNYIRRKKCFDSPDHSSAMRLADNGWSQVIIRLFSRNATLIVARERGARSQRARKIEDPCAPSRSLIQKQNAATQLH